MLPENETPVHLAQEGADAKKYARIVEINEWIAALKEELSDLETELGAKQPKKHEDVPGIGRFERYRTSAKTTWDSERLRAQCIQVAREQRIATDDGEIIEDPVERTVFVLSKAAAFDWRVGKEEERTGLAAFGIQADQYREKEKGILKVRLISKEVAG